MRSLNEGQKPQGSACPAKRGSRCADERGAENDQSRFAGTHPSHVALSACLKFISFDALLKVINS